MPRNLQANRFSGTEPRITQSNTSSDMNESVNRPVAVNKYRAPIAPLKVNKAELMLERLV
jgi:hypothetical protein